MGWDGTWAALLTLLCGWVWSWMALPLIGWLRLLRSTLRQCTMEQAAASLACGGKCYELGRGWLDYRVLQKMTMKMTPKRMVEVLASKDFVGNADREKVSLDIAYRSYWQILSSDPS